MRLQKTKLSTRLNWILLLFAATLLPIKTQAQATLRVGSGQPYTSIQSAINAANSGDTVLVDPGIYYEQITCTRSITVLSSAGAASTMIDGSRANGFVVTIGTPLASDNSFRAPAILDGFTIQNGSITNPVFASDGGGVTIGGNATVRNNTVLNNYPSGITVRASNALIQSNHILQTLTAANAAHSSTGIAIAPTSVFPYSYIFSPPSLTIDGNLIENNYGTGILNYYATQNDPFNYPAFPYLFTYANNIVRNNGAGSGAGGILIYAYGGTHMLIDNLITGNSGTGLSTELGASVGSSPPFQPTGLATNNTLTSNNTSGARNQGTELSIFGVRQTITNNLIVHAGTTSVPALYCGQGTYGLGATPIITTPDLDHNDLYAPNSPALTPAGTGCVGTWTANRFEDPLFSNPAASDFHLSAPSPEIDAGNNAAPSLPAADLDGSPRVQDGSGRGTAIVDIGAYEYSGPNTVAETLTSSPNPSAYGQSVTFTTQLSARGGTPTGSIQYLDAGTLLAIVPVSSAGSAVFTSSSLALGTHIITSNYLPTGSFEASSATLSQVIAGDLTTTNLICTPSTLYVGSASILNTTVTSAYGPPTGSINFADNGTTLGQSVLSSGATLYQYTAQTAGTHILTATYLPSGAFAGSSASCSVVISLKSSTVTLTASPNPATVGQSVSFTANVAYGGPSQSFASYGSVTFIDGSTALGTVPLTAAAALGSSTAVLVTATLAAGNHIVTATLNPLTGYSPASATLLQNVSTLAAAATLAVTPTSATVGSTLTYNAFVQPANSPGPAPLTGPISFFVDGVAAGPPITVNNGTAALSSNSLAPGTHQITCNYSGDSSYAPASCNTVVVSITAAPTVLTLTSSSNPATALSAVSFTLHLATGTQRAAGNLLTLNLSGTAGAPFAVSLQTDSNGNATYATSTLTPGSYTVAGAFTSTASLLGSSTSLAETITAIPSITTLTSSRNPAFSTQPITLTASVANSGGANPIAAVTFFDGSTPLGSTSVQGMLAVLTISSLSVGSHTLTARYPGDTNLLSSISAPVQQIVDLSDYAITSNPAALTLVTGHHTTFSIIAESLGAFTDQLQLDVDNLPPHVRLQLKQGTLSLAQGGQVSTTAYLDTDDVLGYLSRKEPLAPTRNSSGTLAWVTLPFASMFLLTRRRSCPVRLRLTSKLLCLLTVICFSALSGCSGKYPASAAPGGYIIQINVVGSATRTPHVLSIPFTVTE